MARSSLPPLAVRAAARRARRSLALRWLLVAAAAAFAAVQVDRLGAAAEASRRAWGDAVPVAVAARPLAAGTVVDADDVTVERWPRAVVPDDALTDPPVGQVVVAAIVAGEAVVPARLAPAGLTGAAALVPPGWRALAVPAASGLGLPLPPLAPGDRVDVLAPAVVVEDAVVVAVADAAVTIAVPARTAPALADALATSVVSLALRGAG